MNAGRIERIRERLQSLQPEHLVVNDDSHMHVGHPGARDGRGHFSCTIVSESFRDRSMLERHRMVYEALGDLMLTDIHAMSIRALTPEQLDRNS